MRKEYVTMHVSFIVEDRSLELVQEEIERIEGEIEELLGKADHEPYSIETDSEEY